MKKQFKIAVVAGTLAVCMMAATACQKQEASPAGGSDAGQGVADAGNTDGAKEFRFAWWGGDPRHEATMKAIEAFHEKNPDITVDPEFGSITGYVEKNSLAIMNGNAADLIQIGSEFVSEYSGNGKNFYDLYQLKDVVDLTQFPEEILQQNVVDGKLMALPVALTGRAFFFNKTTFDEVGVKIPATLDELYEAGKAFEAYNPDYYPLALPEYDRQYFVTYYLQSKYGKPWISDGKLNYSVEEIQDAMEMVNRMEDMHVIPTIATLAGDMSDSLDKNGKWISGQYAGTFQWDSAFTLMRQAVEENADKPGQELILADYIKCGDTCGAFTKISMNLAITSSTKYPSEVAKLMQFLLNDPEGVELCSTERGIPCSSAAIKVLNEKGIGDDMVKAANAKVLENANFVMDPKFENASLKANPDGVYFKVYGKLSTRDITTEEAAQQLHDGVVECLSE